MAVNGRMIVDAQAHLWKAESPDWKWVPGRKPQLPEPFTIEKLVPLMDEAGVDRVVIVPPSWPGDRNDYALEAVRRYPTRFGVMGRLPIEKRDVAEPLLPKWKDQPGMLGVRLTFQNDMMKLLTEGHTDWFWPLAEKYGLPVMFFAPRNVPRFAQVAERHPGLTMIIDHMSLNQEIAKEGKIKESVDTVVALAKYPERLSQDIVGADLFVRGLSLARHDGAPEALLRRLRPATFLLGHRHHQRLRQVHLSAAHHPFHRGAAVSVRE